MVNLLNIYANQDYPWQSELNFATALLAILIFTLLVSLMIGVYKDTK